MAEVGCRGCLLDSSAGAAEASDHCALEERNHPEGRSSGSLGGIGSKLSEPEARGPRLGFCQMGHRRNLVALPRLTARRTVPA